MNVVSVKRLKVSIHVYYQLFKFSYEINIPKNKRVIK
jgi:hypothetical protein